MLGKLPFRVREMVKGTLVGPEVGEINIRSVEGIPDWVAVYSSSDHPRAMTIGYSMWFEPEAWDWSALFEETKHVEQFYRYEDDFMNYYTQAIWIYGYEKNPFEVEAKEYSREMIERFVPREV